MRKINKYEDFCRTNPYALYVYCDGAMGNKNDEDGGVGINIIFPESIEIDSIEESIGRYVNTNIHRIELEALCQGMEKLLHLKRTGNINCYVNPIIFRTDRFSLCDTETTSIFKIREWRKQKWCGKNGKPILNRDLLDELDKLRKKVSEAFRATVRIEWVRRKHNRTADKLSKKGKTTGAVNKTIEIKGHKIGKRLFKGDAVNYEKLKPKDILSIHIYRKRPAGDLNEISAEICEGNLTEKTIKIYTDDSIEKILKRRNKFSVKIKEVFEHHITIYKTIKSQCKKKILELLEK